MQALQFLHEVCNLQLVLVTTLITPRQVTILLYVPHHNCRKGPCSNTVITIAEVF